jgi:hypothetical protein
MKNKVAFETEVRIYVCRFMKHDTETQYYGKTKHMSESREQKTRRNLSTIIREQ